MYQRSELRADKGVIHYQFVERKTKENELIILVRESCGEMEANGELTGKRLLDQHITIDTLA